ncbi:hypothetical protein CBM2637_B70008 [Cupriavidus taiwanensis]|nr:hypothetical protein CBM2637_B70008 [Cupriavidus taiwanensis]
MPGLRSSASVSHVAGCLPSPACGRGAGGEGRRLASIATPHFVGMRAFSPAPLP